MDAMPTLAQLKATAAAVEAAAVEAAKNPKFFSLAYIRANKKNIAVALGVGGLAAAAFVYYEKKNGKQFNITSIMDASSNGNIYKTMFKVVSDETFTTNGTLTIQDTDCIPKIKQNPDDPYKIVEVMDKSRIIIITPDKVITPGTKGTMIYYTSFQDELNLVAKAAAANTVAPLLSTGSALATGTLQGTLEGLGLGGLGKGVSDMSDFIFDNIFWFIFGLALLVLIFFIKSIFF
jgi:hypothetical protein